MEGKLGLVGDRPSRYREKVLRNNGITKRYYALDDCGHPTHLNQDLAALAIEDALTRRGISPQEVGMLAVGTTLPDLVMPGFASMVHGRLGGAPLEILTAGGICASGASALLHAWSALRARRHERAIAAGSELVSPLMRGRNFEQESVVSAERGDSVDESYHYFNADFLRWMLSDGAGAMLLESTPPEDGPRLRLDWIELTSYAHALPTCMFMGTSVPAKPKGGLTWLTADTPDAAYDAGMLVIRQDTKLLSRHIIPIVVEELHRLTKKGRVDPDAGYDWFLPHISSLFFEQPLIEGLAEAGLPIPRENWFTNLATKGNMGSASFYVMLDEAVRSGLFSPGDRILAMVPESGRFSMSFSQFTYLG